MSETDTGRAVAQDLRRSGEYRVALWPVRIDKETRLITQSVQFEARQVHVPAEAPWLADWLAELLAFPNGRNDDQVDSTGQALHYLTGKMHPLHLPREPRQRRQSVKRPARMRR